MMSESKNKLAGLAVYSNESGLSYDFLRRACLAGKLKHIRCGVKIMVRADWFEEFLEAEARGGSTE